MDRRYANATEEELAAMSDRTCIICREELTAAAANNEAAPNGQAQHQDGPNMTPKKLPCGHVFHFQCLRSWLERQQSCPTWYVATSLSILKLHCRSSTPYSRRTVLDTTQPNRNDAQPQQPQANGLRPAPPQPGMAPQEPGQGGGIRWFGRFFGIPAQPQLIPGGFPHGFMPPPPGAAAPGQPAPPPAQQGQAPGQPIPGYGAWPPYPPPPGYLYQPGYPPFPYQYYPPPMYPQLPPNAQVLRGFYGPGGVYYPWPVDQGQGQQQGNQHPGTGPSGSVTSPPPGSSSSTNQTPTPTVPTESNVPRSSSSSTSSSSSMSSTSTELSEPEGTSGEAERSSTPREAAALAALRRFNTLPRVPPTVNGPITRPSAPPPVAPTDSIPVPPSSNPSSQPAQSTDHTQPSSSIGSTSTSSAPTTAPNPDARQDVPSLIPLYDFGNHPGLRHQAAMGGPSSFYRSSPGFGRQQYPSPFGGYTSQQQTSSRSSGHINNHNNTNNNNNNNNNIHNHHQQQNGIYGTLGSRTSPTSRRTPFHQLPTTLTEEQLGRLDRVTREGIDERLRVLENVSGAVYRCIEELTRIRSVLPGVVLAQAQGGGGGEGGQGGGNETGSGRRTEESVSQVGASEPSGSGTVDPGLEIPKDSVTRCGGGGDDDEEEEDEEEGRNGAAVDHPLEQDTAAVPSNRNIQVEDSSSQAASSSLTGLVPEELSPPES